MLDRLDETIAATSTPGGFGLLGIVRLSGPAAVSIAEQMATGIAGGSLEDVPGSTRVEGQVLIDDHVELPATFLLFREPRSYTRQDIVEIHTSGSPALLELVRRRAIELGAVAAAPGEFTTRAFLNGAMDLASAEAVGEIINAKTDTHLRAAREMRDGALHQKLTVVRGDLAELLALVEADIDFSEEPIDFITPTELTARLSAVRNDLDSLVRYSTASRRLDTSPRILLLGAPNAGKSSLMNRLSGTSRAICTAVAGTTRDLLEAPVDLGRGEAILLDAAGVDDPSDGGRSENQCAIERNAQAAALAAAEHADLICLVVDVTRVENAVDRSWVGTLPANRVVWALNKCDLASKEVVGAAVTRMKHTIFGTVCVVSALRGTGMEQLRDALATSLGTTGATTHGESLLVNERQRLAIAAAEGSLERAAKLSESSAETIDCADVLAFELREALDSLGAVTGEVTTDDLLGAVFAKFCIGK